MVRAMKMQRTPKVPNIGQQVAKLAKGGKGKKPMGAAKKVAVKIPKPKMAKMSKVKY